MSQSDNYTHASGEHPNLPYHIPALLPQCLEALDVKPDGIYIDCTLGGGGHTRGILTLLDASHGGRLLSLDQDMEAIEHAMAGDWSKNEAFTPVHANFRFIRNFARYHGVYGRVDGILADLGVSFHHFDSDSRGFSFRFPEGPLDMRMNRKSHRTAAEILNTATADELASIFKLYGELSDARRLARAIEQARALQPFETSRQLVDVATGVLNPRQVKKEMAQVFQALRIVVNNEMEALGQLLTGAVDVLRPDGRLAVITYHSLEDRLVKNFMRSGNLEGTVVKDFYGRVISSVKPLYTKPIVPDPAEIEANPRSRSAKLRVAVKLSKLEP